MHRPWLRSGIHPGEGFFTKKPRAKEQVGLWLQEPGQCPGKWVRRAPGPEEWEQFPLGPWLSDVSVSHLGSLLNATDSLVWAGLPFLTRPRRCFRADSLGSTWKHLAACHIQPLPQEASDRDSKANSITIAIFICKNPDIKRSLSVFPGFPFLQKQKGTYKPCPLLSRTRCFSGSPPPAPPPVTATCFIPGRLHPHMLWCFPTRVEFRAPRLEVHKEGVGVGAVCGTMFHGVQGSGLVVGFLLHPA